MTSLYSRWAKKHPYREYCLLIFRKKSYVPIHRLSYNRFPGNESWETTNVTRNLFGFILLTVPRVYGIVSNEIFAQHKKGNRRTIWYRNRYETREKKMGYSKIQYSCRNFSRSTRFLKQLFGGGGEREKTTEHIQSNIAPIFRGRARRSAETISLRATCHEYVWETRLSVRLSTLNKSRAIKRNYLNRHQTRDVPWWKSFAGPSAIGSSATVPLTDRFSRTRTTELARSRLIAGTDPEGRFGGGAQNWLINNNRFLPPKCCSFSVFIMKTCFIFTIIVFT